MKSIGLASTTFLLLLLGAVAPAYAQPTQHDKAQNGPPPLWLKKNQAPGHQGQQPQGNGHQGQQPQGNGHQGPPPQARGPQGPPPRASRPYRPEARGRDDGHRTVWREHRAQNWQSEHRSWQDRGGYDGYRIPEYRYRGHFGPRHVFRIHRYPMGMVDGFINFQLGGFGFSVMDPVPEYWSDTWYDNDDVYIDDSGDGYYLHNRRHPQDRIAIRVNIR